MYLRLSILTSFLRKNACTLVSDDILEVSRARLGSGGETNSSDTSITRARPPEIQEASTWLVTSCDFVDVRDVLIL